MFSFHVLPTLRSFSCRCAAGHDAAPQSLYNIIINGPAIGSKRAGLMGSDCSAGEASHLSNCIFESQIHEPQAHSSLTSQLAPSPTLNSKNQVQNQNAHITSAPELRARQNDCSQLSQSAAQAVQQASQQASQSIQQASQAAQQASRSASEAIQQAQQSASQSILSASRSAASAASSASSAVFSVQSSAASALARATQSVQSLQLSASAAQVRLFMLRRG